MPGTSFNLCSLNNLGKGKEFKKASNPYFADFNSAIDFSTTNPSPCLNDDSLTTTPMVDSFIYSKLPMDSQCEFFETKNNANVDVKTEIKADKNTALPELQNVYNQDKGKALAKIANKTATVKNTQHKCLQGVRETLNKAGLVQGSMGISAYQAADVLAQNEKFKEISVAREDLKKLPAGCVVVWGKNTGGSKSSDKHGHIAVTTGDGGEASDHVADTLYMFNSKHRVFVPIGINKSE